jgi:hypothetical protein
MQTFLEQVVKKSILHNELLKKHKDKIREYVDASSKSNGSIINNEDNEDHVKHKEKLKSLESHLTSIKETQRQLYFEIKNLIRNCYLESTMSYQDIERCFRNHSLNVYLTADKVDRTRMVAGTDLVDKNGEQVDYRVDCIVTDSEKYYKEQVSNNNYDNLQNSGDLVIVDEEKMKKALSDIEKMNTMVDDVNDY